VKAPALFNATVTQAERRVVYRKLRFDKRLGALPEPRVAAIRHRRMLAQSSTKRALAAPKVPMGWPSKRAFAISTLPRGWGFSCHAAHRRRL